MPAFDTHRHANLQMSFGFEGLELRAEYKLSGNDFIYQNSRRQT